MIDPRGMELLDWADSVIGAVNVQWDVAPLTDPADWQTWAVGFVRAPALAQRVLPDPFQFSDWRDWAMRAFPMLEGAG
jgi:hypothetical protein